MKKLLAIFASSSLIMSAGAVTSCTYVNFYKLSIENKIEELVNTSKLALFPAIAGAAGTDGQAARTYLNDKKISDYTSETQTNLIGDSLKGYFGESFNFFDSLSSITGLSDSEKQEMSGNTYQENTWSTIYGAFSTIYGLVGQGLSPQLVNTLLSLLGGVGLGSSIVEPLDTILTGLQGSSSIEDHFNEINDKVKTNQDYMNWFFSDLSYFLSDCTDNDTKGVIQLEDLQGKDDFWKTITDKIGYYLDLYINQGKGFTLDINSFLKYIPTAIYALSQYLSAFDKYQNNEIGSKVDLSDDESNHLFSSSQTNYEIIQKVASDDATKSTIFGPNAFTGLINAVNALLSADNSSSVYSFTRVLQILFEENDDPANVRLFSTPVSGDGTESPTYDKTSTGGALLNYIKRGFLQITPFFDKGEWSNNSTKHNYGLTPLISAIIYGALNTKVSSFSIVGFDIKKLLNLDNYEELYSSLSNLISLFLSNNNLTSMFEKLSTDLYGLITGLPSIIPSSLIKPYIDDIIPVINTLKPFSNKIFSELMFGETIIPEIFTLLGNYGVQIPDDFKDIKNINDFLGKGINIMGAEISIKQLIMLVEQIAPVFANMKSLIGLINKMIELPTDEYTFYDGDNNKINTTKVTDDNKYLEFDGVKCKTGLSFALMLIDVSRTGWSCSVNDKKQSIGTVGASLLGYSTSEGGGVIKDNSVFSLLRDLLNDQSSTSVQEMLMNLKLFLEQTTESFTDEKSRILDGYLNPSNYSVSDISYNNFANNEEPSTLDYNISYSYNDVKLKYSVEIKLDPSESDYYKFSKITKIT